MKGTALLWCGLALQITSCETVTPMPKDQACREVGWAIAARVYSCTGDPSLATARAEDFDREATCIEWSADDPEFSAPADTASGPVRPEDLFSCAFTLRNLPCDTVTALGDDLSAWLATDPTCAWVVSLDEGGAR